MPNTRFEIPFQRVESVEFPISKIIEDNAVKDMARLGAFSSPGVGMTNRRGIRRTEMHRGMRTGRTVKADRATLIESLQKNKEAHQAELVEALEGWRIEVEEDLKDVARACRKAAKDTENFNGFEECHLNVPEKPQDYSDEYDKAIHMFEVEVEEHVELTGDEIEAYIHDNWDWSHHSKALNMGYVATRAARG